MLYDLVIIGAGPAGLTASIYASRYKLSHLVLGKLLGGTISLASKVENYPGFTSISGLELAQKMAEQVKSLGAEIVMGTVGRIEKIGPTSLKLRGVKEIGGFRVFGDDGREWETKTLIIATGSERRRLGVAGEEKYQGKGVSYCTTCDAPFFKNKIVALVGGSDAAVSGAVHAAEFAQKVYIIYRGESLRAEPAWMEEALKNSKIKILFKTNILEIIGDGTKVTGVKLDNPSEGKDLLPLDGVFIEIGGVPGVSLAAPLGVKLDENSFVRVSDDMSTNVAGLFCAGDFTDKSQVLVQMTTACAQGAIASASAYKFLKGKKPAQILGVGER